MIHYLCECRPTTHCVTSLTMWLDGLLFIVVLFFNRVSTTDDVLEFWHINELVYPTLSQVAQLYLAMSASSIPVESMFSITGLICNSRRSSLAPEKLHRVSFVHDNIKLITETEFTEWWHYKLACKFGFIEWQCFVWLFDFVQTLYDLYHFFK